MKFVRLTLNKIRSQDSRRSLILEDDIDFNKKINRFRYLFAALFIFFVVAIEILATTTARIEAVENSWDKLNHIIAFAALYFTLNFGFPKLNFTAKFAALMIYGVQIEIVQAFLPNRYFSLLDIFADFLGIAFGATAVKILLYFTAKNV